ncbi:phage tail assembly chaperone, partial [Desulfovibrio sp. ZJ200]|uniref:phage tail assembly chaperone n=1 Tax=Desulfovibrio sp. ZJ200 TaxID=2709792 RepID=UPI001F154143
RDRRLSAADYLIMPDYPLDDITRSSVMAWRQALRDLPAQAGAPWDGGGEATPWPVNPRGVEQ